jgi:hypothetical protein
MIETEQDVIEFLNRVGWGIAELEALQYLADRGFFGNIPPREDEEP